MKNEENAGMKGLPETFVKKMRGLLGEEAKEFFESYDRKRTFGLRVNPLKISGELPEFLGGLEKIPWSEEGYYYEETMGPGKHPFHEAGLYYIQEPSAQICAEALKPEPGEKILDLCAAPGGKSTHLAGKMGQKGLLVCNEIHRDRAKILSRNVERMGIANAVVTNMEPAGLVPAFSGFFDGIAVDAPCSGEGMFRKDENARGEWSPDHVALCARRQDEILDCASAMVKPGGRIVYSTCTFSPEENEGTVVRFLKRHPEFYLERIPFAEFFSEGRPEWAGGEKAVKKTVRVWPHHTRGEGHFMALFVRNGRPGEENMWEENGEKETVGEREEARERAETGKRGETGEKGKGNAKGGAGKKGKAGVKGKRESVEPEELKAFFTDNLSYTEGLMEGRRFVIFGDNLYLMPEEMPELSGLKILRAGLHLGTLRKGRMEPSHALALFLKKDQVLRTLEIGTGELAERYLRGESLFCEKNLKGWVLVTCGGYSLGFGKADRGMLKNHYPKGLRRG
ncbi:RsmF rRNA methyltransferase first C-terminal domain-containing protein [Lachnospiraceae bacterium 45-P1]